MNYYYCFSLWQNQWLKHGQFHLQKYVFTEVLCLKKRMCSGKRGCMVTLLCAAVVSLSAFQHAKDEDV
jgi:hypothetical protein